MRRSLPGRGHGGHGSQRWNAEGEEGSSWMVPSVVCYCGKTAKIQTSWTAAHPGRRFYICGKNRCRYWEWGDPQMCERSKQIIPRLLRKINMLEDAKKSRPEKLKKNPWFWVSCLLFVIVLWLMYGKGKDNEGLEKRM
ncbi:hypothetical protein CerSpe_224460 [Prunus speciosa]